MQSSKMTVAETLDHIGESVVLNGWVHAIRNMGKIVFIELRDQTGLIQVVVSDSAERPKLGVEYVITAEGEIRKRGEKFINANLATGQIELGATKIEVLSQSADLPFEVKKDTHSVNEELRLQYRYLDLRSQRMSDNLRLRHKVIKAIRDFYDDRGFIEVETPMLTKGTPEGAREFLVPSRLHPEKFYVLPQSPQQFKQLLMVAGVGRYYQIVKCLRDEDQRGDRQPEFTQLDVEMSFVDRDEILALHEELMTEVVRKIRPKAKLKTPFPRLTYDQAMKSHKTDKPDLRENKDDPDELAFAWVIDFPLFEINQETSKVDAVHHPFTAPLEVDRAKLSQEPHSIKAAAYDLVLNGYEVGGGSIRINDADLQEQVFELLGLGRKEVSDRFGHMLEAFRYGVPPHGGIAFGLDRLIMVLAGEPNIREVMAFPKTGDARDPMTGAPAAVEAERLNEAHIQTVPLSQKRRK